MSAALYQATYSGSFDSGGAVLYIGNGIIFGMDVGELTYDGTYTTRGDGSLNGIVSWKL